MKRIYLTMILALMFMFSISVNAEGSYAPVNNSYTNSMSDGAKTVIIYKGTAESDITGENIYYINQCDNEGGFTSLEMMMKADAPAGTYTVLTNGGNSATFTISPAQAVEASATEMESLGGVLTDDDSYSAAFGFNASALLTDASQISMVIGDMAYTTDLFGESSIINWGAAFAYTEEETLKFAIQIDGIGSEYMTGEGENLTPNFKLYFK